MSEEIGNIVNLSDHSVDLSVYRPEKALHLEWMDVTKRPLEMIAELTERIDALERERREHRVAWIWQKLTDKFTDRKAFARAVFSQYPERKDFGTFCRKIVYPFLEGKLTSDPEYAVMQSMLGLSADMPISFQLFSLPQTRSAIRQSIDPLFLFIEHFSLIWRYREGICNTPELASILPGCFGFFQACNHHATLGEVLYLYNEGKLRYGKHCPKCHAELLLYHTGGLLSGAGDSSGFCPNCGYKKYDNHGVNPRGRDFLESKFACPKVKTKWTMADLVSSLINYEMEERALTLATQWHKGQKDKAGNDYIEHPIRVANMCKQPEEKVVALLHDTMEDCGVTVDMLREQDFDDNIIEAVQACTKRKHEDYFDYIRRVGSNPISRVVKMCDLRDNLNLIRFAESCPVRMDIHENDLRNGDCCVLSDKDLYRLNKYLVAYRMLENMDENES